MLEPEPSCPGGGGGLMSCSQAPCVTSTVSEAQPGKLPTLLCLLLGSELTEMTVNRLHSKQLVYKVVKMTRD